MFAPLDSYATYCGLPFAAGTCTLSESQRPGLTIEQCVARIKRYHYALKRLHEIFIARLTAERIAAREAKRPPACFWRLLRH